MRKASSSCWAKPFKALWPRTAGRPTTGLIHSGDNCAGHTFTLCRRLRLPARSARHRARRDFQKLVERGGASAGIGQALLTQVEQLFSLWHRVREGTLSRIDFQAEVIPIRARVVERLCEGTRSSQLQTHRTCENILKLEVALWTFVRVAGVEPTNNGAECPLPRAILWRRRSFGTQSAAGSQFVERIV